MTQSFEPLSETKLDVLREIGNIGAGNAATSLSRLLNLPINLSVPVVRILDISSTVEAMGGPEAPVVGILVRLTGQIEGMMMCVMRQEFVARALELLLGSRPSGPDGLTKMERSALEETGNIILSAYACSIAELSQIPINHTVPAITSDMVGAVVQTAAAEMSAVSEKAIYIENEFLGEGGEMSANILLWPTPRSLDRLLAGLGITL